MLRALDLNHRNHTDATRAARPTRRSLGTERCAEGSSGPARRMNMRRVYSGTRPGVNDEYHTASAASSSSSSSTSAVAASPDLLSVAICPMRSQAIPPKTACNP